MNILLFTVLLTTIGNAPFKTINTDTTGDKIITIAVPFNAIKIYGDLTTYLKEGNTNEILIKANDVSHKIKFRTKDSVLIIRRKFQRFSNHIPEISITFKKVDVITLIGDAMVQTIGDLTCDYLHLAVKGDGKIYAKTKSIEVKTIITGKGKIAGQGNFKNTFVNRDDSDILQTTYSQ